MTLEILREIETFLKARNMSAARFGLLALNDKGLVYELRKGRDILSRTEEKIRKFMLTYSDA